MIYRDSSRGITNFGGAPGWAYRIRGLFFKVAALKLQIGGGLDRWKSSGKGDMSPPQTLVKQGKRRKIQN